MPTVNTIPPPSCSGESGARRPSKVIDASGEHVDGRSRASPIVRSGATCVTERSSMAVRIDGLVRSIEPHGACIDRRPRAPMTSEADSRRRQDGRSLDPLTVRVRTVRRRRVPFRSRRCPPRGHRHRVLRRMGAIDAATDACRTGGARTRIVTSTSLTWTWVRRGSSSHRGEGRTSGAPRRGAPSPRSFTSMDGRLQRSTDVPSWHRPGKHAPHRRRSDACPRRIPTAWNPAPPSWMDPARPPFARLSRAGSPG